MTKMNNWEKELSNLLTKMSEHYLIDDEFEKELKWFITNALNQQRGIAWDDGYQCGFFKLDIKKAKNEFLTKLKEEK